MRSNKYLTQLTTRSTGVVSGQSFGSDVVSGQSFGSSVVSLPCITSMYSSFSLWIILLPSDSRCFCCSVKPCSFFVVFGYAWFLCNRCFFVIWGDNLGGTFVPVFGHGVCLIGCFVWHFMVRKFDNSLWCFHETERLWFCVYLLSSQAVHERSCPWA